MTGDGSEKPFAIDVDSLMEDLRGRIAEKKAAGLYGVDDLAADLRVDGDPWDAEQLERVQIASLVMPGLITSPSEGQFLGKAMERVKEQIVRASWRNLADLADQLNRFHTEMTAYAMSVGAEVQRMRDELREIRAGQDGGGLAALDARLDRLSAGLPAAGATADALGLTGLPAMEEAPALAPLIGREMNVPDSGIGLLLGAGTGELLDALGSGYRGIDARDGLATTARSRGHDVLTADPVAYVEGLGAASVSRIVVRELAESRSLGDLGRLLAGAERSLVDDGLIAVITRNYAAASERDAFWKNPWRRRPVEPETVAALMRAAGFDDIRTIWAGEDESADADSARPTARCAVVNARSA